MIDLPDLRELLDGCSFLSIDFETTGTNLFRDRLLGFSVVTDKGGGYYPIPPYRTGEPVPGADDLARILAPVLVSVPVLGHNVKFELHCLARITPVRVRYPVDTLTGLWLINEIGDLGLKANFSLITGEEFPDFKQILRTALDEEKGRVAREKEAWVLAHPKGQVSAARKQAAQLFPMPLTQANEDIPIDLLAPYCLKDSLLALVLWVGYVRPALVAEGMLDYFYAYEMPYLSVLFEMEEAGVDVDLGVLKRLAQETHGKVVDLQAQLYDRIGHPINLDSNDELKKLVFEEMGYAPTDRVSKKTGVASLDVKALQLLESEHGEATDFFTLLREYREARKTETTYALAYPTHVSPLDGRIHTSLNRTGTATGRLSSSEPNLQNVDKSDKLLRSAFVAEAADRLKAEAREEMALIDLDLEQAEYRILADRTGDPVLIGCYRDGRDLHDETIGKFPGMERRTGKVVNFGISYRMGKYNLRETIGFSTGKWVSVEEAASYIEGWHDTYRFVRPWYERVEREAEKLGYVLTRLGRRRHLPELRANSNASYGERSYAGRQGVNVLIQGDVADWMMIAKLRLFPLFRRYGGELILQVHDQVVGRVPKSVALEVLEEAKAILAGSFTGLKVPMSADGGIGPDWAHIEDPKELAKVA